LKTNEKEDSESTLIKLNASDSLPNMIEATTPKIEKISLEYKTDHLLGYDELTTATALFGDEYKLIFKTLWYILLSYQIRTSKLSVGRIKPDGRISGLFIINSGRGKGELKRVQKEYVKYFNGNYREPTSLHAEQLVGKSVYDKKNKEYELNSYEKIKDDFHKLNKKAFQQKLKGFKIKLNKSKFVINSE